MNKVFWLTVVSAGFLYAGMVSAEPEELVVTGTYSEVTTAQLSASVSVLDRSTIERLNKRTMADLLKTVPGVLVEEQGGAGGLVNVSLRGGEFNFTLVMVDGVPLNDPTNTRGGSFDFGNLNLDNIERIEIVRGPQSAIYGSDALSGVINIITSSPQSGTSRRLTLEGGEYDYYRAGVGFSGGDVDGLGYNLQLNRYDSGEAVAGSFRDSNDATLSLIWQALEHHRITVNYRFADGERRSYPEQSGGPLLAQSDALDHSDYRDQSWRLQWQSAISTYWHSTFEANRYQRDENYESPGIVPFSSVPPNGAQTEFTRDNLRWINRLGNNQNWLHFGFDQRTEKGQSEGVVDFGLLIPTAFELDRTTRGVFADATVSLSDATLLQLSARHDDPEGADSEDSYNIGLRHSFNPVWTVRINWGQAFKLPSFFALGDSITGNPALVPETAESWDISAEWILGDHSGSLTYFDNHFEELVTFDDLSFTNVNSEPVDTQGVEAQWRWQPVTWPVELLASATYTDIDTRDPDLSLTGRPQWKGGLMLLYSLSNDWELSADYRYTGRQFAGSQHTGSGTITELAAYPRLDLALLWQYSPDLRFSAGLDNSLDKSYQTAVGFPGAGRTLRAGVNFSF